MINKMLEIAKFVDEDKVGISFQMPKSLKSKVEKYCDNNNIKMTTFFNSMVKVFFDSEANSLILDSEFKRLIVERLITIDEKIENIKYSGFDADDIKNYELLIAEQIRLNEILKDL